MHCAEVWAALMHMNRVHRFPGCASGPDQTMTAEQEPFPAGFVKTICERLCAQGGYDCENTMPPTMTSILDRVSPRTMRKRKTCEMVY